MQPNCYWHGIDKSNEISLFEYGFLFRWVPRKRIYEVVYRYNARFYKGWFSLSEWTAWMEKNIGKIKAFPDIETIASRKCMSSKEYLQKYMYDIGTLISDLILCHGAHIIFGIPERWYELEEIKKELGRALKRGK